MPYISLYRKYRSQTFSDLIGQSHVVKTLQNGIASGKISHAYLFTGPRGTGKTSTARLLAKALCCEKGPAAEPCNECSICRSITDGSCMDVYEMDAASEAGVNDVRETIVQAADYKPSVARYKVFIIDEVHDLSAKAFDALLKTVEEPPEHVVFILATTEYNKVPPTIRSRCQKHEFHRGTQSDLVSRLEYVAKGEGLEIEPAALSAIARMADGGYRDALTLLEQVSIAGTGKLTVQDIYDQLGLVADDVVDKLLVAVREGDVAVVTTMVSEIGRMGRDPRSLVESMMYRLADMTRIAYGVEAGSTGDAAREAALHETTARIGQAHLLSLRGALAEAHKAIRDITLPRLWLEAELLRISQVAAVPAPKAVVAAPREERKPLPQPKSDRSADKPERVADPSPEPAKAEESEPVPTKPKPRPVATAQPLSGDPALDRAIAVWSEARIELAGVSPTMAVKLADTRVVACGEASVTIEFKRQLECDWVLDPSAKKGPARQAAIREAVQKHAGESWQVKYVVAKRDEPANTDAHTVELPSEGQKLIQMARDVFRVQN